MRYSTSMNVKFVAILIALAFIELVASSDSNGTSVATAAVEQQKVQSCSDVCEATFPLHTFSKPDNLFACHRGCRLFGLTELLTIGESADAIRASCLNECNKIYLDVNNNNGCHIGCKNEISRRSFCGVIDGDDDESFSSSSNLGPTYSANYQSMLSFPLVLMRRLFDDMSRKASVVFSKSSYTFLIGHGPEGSKKVIFISSDANSESQPFATQSEILINDQMENDIYDVDSSTSAKSEDILISADKPASRLEWNFMWPRDMSSGTIQESSKGSETNKRSSWFSCFSNQGRVPRWLLATVLCLAIIVLGWICFATTATAPHHRMRRHIGIGSDLPFLMLHNEPLKFCVDDSVTAIEEEKKVIPQDIEKPPSYEEARDQPEFKSSLSTQANN